MASNIQKYITNQTNAKKSLLKFLSFVTSHYVTGMQLVVICNYKFGIV